MVHLRFSFVLFDRLKAENNGEREPSFCPHHSWGGGGMLCGGCPCFLRWQGWDLVWCLSPTRLHAEATVGHTFPKEDQCLIKDKGVAVFPLCRSQTPRLIPPIWVHFGFQLRSPLISVPQSLCFQSLWPLVNLRSSRSLSASRCTVRAGTACLWGEAL